MNSLSNFPEAGGTIPARSRGVPEQALFAAFLVLMALAVFLEQTYDETLQQLIYEATDAGSATLWQAVSRLGSAAILAPVVGAVSLWLFWRRQGEAALGLAFGWTMTSLTVEWLKWLTDRSRPLGPHWETATGSAFPSGHAAESLYVCLWLGLAHAGWRCAPNCRLLLRSFQKAGPWLVALVAIAVGYSRVALGVHWPSDVAAGWAVGAFFCGLAGLLQPDG